MSQFIINGGKTLKGSIAVSGAKNHALKMIAATMLTSEKVTLTRVPDIEDVRRMFEIIEDLGVQVENKGNGKYFITAKEIKKNILHETLSPKVRTSIQLIGPMLIRLGEATLPYPGGCSIGRRPIDLFLKGFKSFGAVIDERENTIHLSAKKLKPAEFIFPFVSHTVTEALMITASMIAGTSRLVNAAMEPEVVALAEFLNKCGAKIKGAGTPNIEIEGVSKIKGGECEIIPDRIEAGTFAALAAASKSQIKITNCNPKHIEIPLLILRQMGVPIKTGEDWVEVGVAENLKGLNLTTHEYPGFPTDLQAPFTVALTQAKGQSLVHETIFEGRLFYVDKLDKMCANILLCDPHRILVAGPKKLRGTRLESPDIRAGMGLLIAGLIARGTTKIDNIYQIDRGYEKIDERLRAIGADITRSEKE